MVNKSAKSVIVIIIILSVLVFSISYFVLADNSDSINQITDKEFNSDKYQTIETENIKFELPYYATHYWINDAPDRYEVIIKNFSIKDNDDYILRATWYDDRYISESLQIHYEFKDNRLKEKDIKFYSLDKYDKSCVSDVASSISATPYEDCEKEVDDSKLRFITPKIEIGHLISYEYRLEENYTCFDYDLINITHFIFDCDLINVSYPIYSWLDFPDTGIKIDNPLPDFIAIDDINVSACGTLNTANEVYNLNKSITGIPATCFVIGENNITLDMAGFNITGDDETPSVDYGIDINGYNFTTIKNGFIYGFGGVGIYLRGNSSNSSIINNTVGGDYNGGRNYNGIRLEGSYNTVSNNTIINSRATGILIWITRNNQISNNNVEKAPVGISSFNSDNTVIVNNTLFNSSIYISYSDNNTITNNNIWNCIADWTCLYVNEAEYNVFDGNKINDSSGYGVHIVSFGGTDSCSHNVFKNTNMTNIDGTSVFLDDGLTSTNTNNTFLNFSYDSESVDSNSELIRQWYFDVNLTVLATPYNFPSQYEADVILYSTEDKDIILNSTTTVNHIVDYGEIIMTEYINLGGTKTYYNNTPTIYVTHDAYYPNTTTYNLSTNIGDKNITLLARPPTVFGTDPPVGSTASSPEPEIVYIPENKTYCGDLICQLDGNDFDVKENYWNCPQDCPGAIGENFDELVFSLTTYCFDKDPSTICFWTQQLFSVMPGVGEERVISCGDGKCEASENFINCKEDCGDFNLNTLLKNCFDNDEMTPCFWDTNLAIYLLFGGFGLFLTLLMVKIKAPGERRKVSGLNYIKIKYKKARRRWIR